MSVIMDAAIRKRITDGYIKLLQTIIRRNDPRFGEAFLEIAIVGSNTAVEATMRAPEQLDIPGLENVELKMFVVFGHFDPANPDPNGDLSEISGCNDLDEFIDGLIQYQLGLLRIIVPTDTRDILVFSEELNWPGQSTVQIEDPRASGSPVGF